MRNSPHIAGPMRSRRRKSVDKFVSATLATAACVGLVGAIGIRTVDDNAAAAVENTAPVADAVTQAAPATSAEGLTEAQLDTYAAELKAEAAKLDAYRKQLARAAKKLQSAQASQAAAAATAAAPTVSVPSTSSVSKPAAKPAVTKPAAKPAVTKPAAKPASKPASSSKSS